MRSWFGGPFWRNSMVGYLLYFLALPLIGLFVCILAAGC